jgi:hypothetical protein
MNRAYLLALLSLGACTSVLGIEDLHEGSRPGAGGEDSTAGTKATGGKNGNGGSTNPNGGSPDPNGGTGNEPSGGVPGIGGTGQGGEGGAPSPSGPTVRGHVIDFWGHQVPNVPVQISNQTIWVALAGADGNNVYDDVYADGTNPYAYWYGPATTQQTAHALFWQEDANHLPTSYLAYDSTLVALAPTGTAKVSLNLTKETIDSGNLQGSVTAPGAGYRTNKVFLRFTSNARIELVDDNGPNTFSYLVPSIAGSSITVAASEGSRYDGWSVVHQDGLAATAKPALKIPSLVSLLTPAGAATGVTASTKFTYQSPAGNSGPFVVQFYSQPDDKTYQTIYVVTAKKQITLPSIIGGGFTLYPGAGYIWSVATHGEFASVDAMASEDGFLDEFSRDELTADGPRTNSGFFTDSVPRGFTTAP